MYCNNIACVCVMQSVCRCEMDRLRKYTDKTLFHSKIRNRTGVHMYDRCGIADRSFLHPGCGYCLVGPVGQTLHIDASINISHLAQHSASHQSDLDEGSQRRSAKSNYIHRRPMGVWINVIPILSITISARCTTQIHVQ